MTTLVACLLTGKGTWAQIYKLIKAHEWEKVILITNDFGKENFKGEADLIVVNTRVSIKAMSEEIFTKIKPKIGFGDVAVNIVSGEGTEHMALITALLKLGAGLRFVDTENEKLVEL